MKRWGIVMIGAVGLLGCGDDTGTGGAGATGGAGSGAGATGAGDVGGAGGAGGGASTSSMQSGTRLKVKVQRAGDADTYWSLYDAELATECSPQTGFDAKLRCYPSGNGYVGYMDAACTQPVASAYVGPCSPDLPAYATETVYSTGGACSSSYSTRAYAVGAEVATMSPFYALVDGVCTDQGLVEVLYAATPVDDASLVEISEVDEPRGADLAARLWTSADGMRLAQFSARDVGRSAECLPLRLSDQERCAPAGAAYVSAPAFADAACSSELTNGIALGTLGCPTPTVATRYETTPQTACESQVAVFEVGAPLADAFRPDENGCNSLAGGSSLFEVGAQVPDASFPGLDRVALGAGSVKAVHHQVGGEDVVSPSQFVLADGSPCFPYAFPDGVRRCGPPTIAFVPPELGARFYADASCTQLIVGLYDSCPTPDSVDYAVLAVDTPGCGALEPHVLGAEHPGDIFIKMGAGACAAAPRDPLQVYRAVGAVAPTTDFVEVTEVTL